MSPIIVFMLEHGELIELWAERAMRFLLFGGLGLLWVEAFFRMAWGVIRGTKLPQEYVPGVIGNIGVACAATFFLLVMLGMVIICVGGVWEILLWLGDAVKIINEMRVS